MSWRAVFAGLVAVSLVLVIALQSYLAAQPIDPDELAQRCRHATPTWPNYDEDIKAQVGARPFAEWKGEPVSAVRDGEGLAIAFTISGPWATRDAAMPVLIRDGLGAVQRDRQWHRDGPHVVYRFPAENGDAALALDSIEVRYPHHTRRLLVHEQAAD